MPASDERITFEIPAGTYRAFVATPPTPPPWPALIVVHPITGLDGMMVQRTRDFAQAGYLAVAPDVYSADAGYGRHETAIIEAAAHLWLGRTDEQVETVLAEYEPQAREQIRAAHVWVMARPTTTYVDVVAGCFAYVRARADVRKIGCIGYCMGGRLAGELAAKGVDLAAGVIYYGSGPKPETLPNIRCPLQGHYAVTDRGITGKVYEFALAMHAAGKSFNYSVYDADHGFGESQARVYNPEAARIAGERAKAFLAKNL